MIKIILLITLFSLTQSFQYKNSCSIWKGLKNPKCGITDLNSFFLKQIEGLSTTKVEEKLDIKEGEFIICIYRIILFTDLFLRALF